MKSPRFVSNVEFPQLRGRALRKLGQEGRGRLIGGGRVLLWVFCANSRLLCLGLMRRIHGERETLTGTYRPPRVVTSINSIYG